MGLHCPNALPQMHTDSIANPTSPPQRSFPHPPPTTDPAARILRPLFCFCALHSSYYYRQSSFITSSLTRERKLPREGHASYPLLCSPCLEQSPAQNRCSITVCEEMGLQVNESYRKENILAK